MIKEIKDNSNKVIETTVNNTKTTIRNIETKLQQKIKAIKEKRDADKKGNKDMYNKQVADHQKEISDAKKDLNDALNTFKTVQRQKEKTNTREVEGDYKQKVQILRNKYEDFKKNYNQETEEKIQEMREKVEKEIKENIAADKTKETTESKTRISIIEKDQAWLKKHEQDKKDSLKKLEAEMEKNLKEVKKPIQEQIEKINKESNELIEKLKQKLADLIKNTSIPNEDEEVKRMEESWTKTKTSVEGDHTDHQKSLNDQLKKLNDNFNKNAKDLIDNNMKQTLEEASKNDDDIEGLKKKLSQDLKDLTDEYNKKLKELTETTETVTTTNKSTLVTDLNKIKSTHNKGIQAEKDALKLLEDGLKTAEGLKIEKTKTVTTTVTKEVTRIRSKCTDMIEGMTTKATKYKCNSHDLSQRVQICLEDKKTATGVSCAKQAYIFPVLTCLSWVFKDDAKTGKKVKHCSSQKIVYPKYVCKGESFEVDGSKYCTKKEVLKPLFFCSEHVIVNEERQCAKESHYVDGNAWKFICKKETASEENKVGGCLNIEKVAVKENKRGNMVISFITDIVEGRRLSVYRKESNVFQASLAILGRRDREVIESCLN